MRKYAQNDVKFLPNNLFEEKATPKDNKYVKKKQLQISFCIIIS